jgi:hypothetical protein
MPSKTVTYVVDMGVVVVLDEEVVLVILVAVIE